MLMNMKHIIDSYFGISEGKEESLKFSTELKHFYEFIKRCLYNKENDIKYNFKNKKFTEEEEESFDMKKVALNSITNIPFEKSKNKFNIKN